MSEQLKNVLIKRKAYIENLILKKKEAMTKAPGGSLRTSTINGHFRYYRFGNENKNGIYLPKKEIELVKLYDMNFYRVLRDKIGG